MNKDMLCTGYLARIGEQDLSTQFFRKTWQEEITLGHKHRWEDNIKNNILKTEYGDLGYIQMAYNCV
jgi:hypothetical protein